MKTELKEEIEHYIDKKYLKFSAELNEYHNLLMKQGEMLHESNKLLKSVETLYNIQQKDIEGLKEKIDEIVRRLKYKGIDLYP